MSGTQYCCYCLFGCGVFTLVYMCTVCTICSLPPSILPTLHPHLNSITHMVPRGYWPCMGCRTTITLSMIFTHPSIHNAHSHTNIPFLSSHQQERKVLRIFRPSTQHDLVIGHHWTSRDYHWANHEKLKNNIEINIQNFWNSRSHPSWFWWSSSCWSRNHKSRYLSYIVLADFLQRLGASFLGRFFLSHFSRLYLDHYLCQKTFRRRFMEALQAIQISGGAIWWASPFWFRPIICISLPCRVW